jgi:hypothetical protein
VTSEPETSGELPEVIDQGDSPIGSLEEDSLEQCPFGEALTAPVARGYVIGLTGPWRSGKTLILNITVDTLGDQSLVVHFNPWILSELTADMLNSP